MLSAGVRGVSCTFCNIFQQNPGSTVAYYHYTLHIFWHIVGKHWYWNMDTSAATTLKKKHHVMQICIWISALQALWYQTLAAIEQYACTSLCTLFEQHLL